ncbi:MAG: glycosyltransferase [Lentisphaeria bacterium]|nr:glycosyltransferase [Lentisphaeria bacterium]
MLWGSLLAISVWSIAELASAAVDSNSRYCPLEAEYLFYSTIIFTLFYFAFQLISAFFSCRWKEKNGVVPACTVIIPAYNEGKDVVTTLETILASDIPENDLQIIAVNDGSQDDTLHHLQYCSARHPGRITIIDLPCNGGKKHALYTAIKQAGNEFIVTVDSDSVVEKDTIRLLLRPFCHPETGAVAGAIYKKRQAENFLVRLFDVMLVFNCGLLRNAQSLFGNVFCTPGALSAYRKSAIMPLLDEWLDQSFLGTPSKIGEDRAIATLLLRSDWRIEYQSAACAETSLPADYSGMCRTLLRWTRSDIRENILMTPFVLRKLKQPDRRSLNLFIHWFLLSINIILPLIMLPAALFFIFSQKSISFCLAVIIISTLISSLIPAAVYWQKRRNFREMIWAFVFGFFSQAALSWISIYSLFTLKNSDWLTRKLPHSRKRK